MDPAMQEKNALTGSPRAAARMEALTGWAAEAVARGHAVPSHSDLEKVALANSAGTDGINQESVEPWATTIAWLLKQTSFGVKAAHAHLPEELYAPAGWVPTLPDLPAPELQEPPVKTVSAAPTEEEAPGVESPSQQPASGPKTPKWETTARSEVMAAVKKFSGPLQSLVDRDANEGDTRLLITDMLCEGLGYDKFTDLTTEFRVKQDFADYGVRIDKQLVAFIEVKRVSQKLNERHLRQVQMYAVNEGVEWMVLTNGRVWQAYHLTGGLPVIVNLALEIDLLGPESLESKAEALFFLHREALKRRRIDELWKHRAATAPEALLGIILSETVIAAIRKEVKRGTGISTTPEAIADVIREGVVDSKLLAKHLLKR
ncbi:type I restriction enzyme HsdR N-terminal domain-containing protein [Arthrobacter sp. zg-Y1110]|uniref:type I restriction enzyme HsdR N-terminal domain-containing protein n=1 Tax=Arthrobacter sp. zg-Y1110 TaxID=2886932 RepID=UPI001D145126|nr:type I restriction enzyme HsdR N-terminal domain-containing protein [Arthrobacter sp. zg-Y1110]MCC3292601.1 type I restriction enzyme HsdR N-terminal domain-containing protein [Arthrobacter sp. zg-Y1110]UWX86968.1 type I restriction enzyme HsdR N-terminal domain-containing protein [Arthrobacter sp. zg-Y1110]